MTTISQEAMLRLTVLDTEDLAVVSALLQDAETGVAEMAYLPNTLQFAVALARFDWPAAKQGRFERCQAGLHFERVLHVARSNWPADPKAPLRLLAVVFSPGEAPAGSVLLTFLDGPQIKLTVECIEAEMRDIGPRWSVAGLPAPPDVISANPIAKD